MAMPSISLDFCIFCYKTIHLPDTSSTRSVILSKLIKFLERSSGEFSEECKSLLEASSDSGLYKLCDKCESTVDSFCELYHKIKCLELQLDLKLDKIVKKIDFSNRIPTRWTNVNSALHVMCQNDSVKVEESRNEMRIIRNNVIKSGLRKLSKSQPRVSLERYNNATSNSTGVPVTEINGLASEWIKTSLSSRDDCSEDPLASLNDTTKTTDINTNSASAIVKSDPDPLSEVKLEHSQSALFGDDGSILEYDRNYVQNSHINNFAGEAPPGTFGDSLEAEPSNNICEMEMEDSTEKVTSLSESASLPVENVVKRKPKCNTNSPVYRTQGACTLCKKIFRDRWNLKRHMMLVHKEELGTSYKCGKCNKNFIDKWYLTNHLKNHPVCGLPKKEFPCVECGRMFLTDWHRKVHMSAHARGKPSKRGAYHEPLISLEVQNPRRQKSTTPYRKFSGAANESKGGELRPVKINNCFANAVNAVFMTPPEAIRVELKDPLEISPEEVPKINT